MRLVALVRQRRDLTLVPPAASQAEPRTAAAQAPPGPSRPPAPSQPSRHASGTRSRPRTELVDGPGPAGEVRPGFTKAEILRQRRTIRARRRRVRAVGGLLSELLESRVRCWIAKRFSHDNRQVAHRSPRSLARRLRSSAVARAEIIEQVLVKVNGEIFTKTDLETRQVAGAAPEGPADRSQDDPADEQLRKMLDEVTPQLMVNVVDEMLMVQRGQASSATR